MAKEKNKPVPVRFDLKLLETLKEEEKIDTPQQALNFLTKFWENNRPAKDEAAVAGESGESGKASAPKPKKSTPAASKATTEEPKAKAAAVHPSGLSGIDLSIWKAEQKEKEKNA